MSLKTAVLLKALFETNDKPTQQDFADLLDSCINTPLAHVVVSEPTTSILVTELDCTGYMGLDIVYNTVIMGNLCAVQGFINGDTTTTMKRVYTNMFSHGANVLSHRDATPVSFGWNSGQASSISKGTNNILIGSNEIVTMGRSLFYGGTNIEYFCHEMMCYKQSSNINSLLIQATSANGIGAGSWFKIYRRP